MAAQGKKSVILKAPFSFMVEQQKMPAGAYQILVELEIRATDGSKTAIVLTLPVSGKTPEGASQVVFNHCGDRYFLAQVWLPEMETRRQTLESREERNWKSGRSLRPCHQAGRPDRPVRTPTHSAMSGKNDAHANCNQRRKRLTGTWRRECPGFPSAFLLDL